MKFYELMKCEKDLNNYPPHTWKNGMVMHSAELDSEILATFSDLEEAKTELAKHPCSAI